MFLVFTLRDIKADSFGVPVFVKSLGELVRDIQSVVNDAKSENLLAKYPADFALYKLGEYDERKGQLALLSLPDHVLDVQSLVSLSRMPGLQLPPAQPEVEGA